MTKITADFIGVEGRAVVISRLSAIASWYGFDVSTYTTWQDPFDDFNEILAGTSVETGEYGGATLPPPGTVPGEIINREFAGDFLPKLNFLNVPSEVALQTDKVFRRYQIPGFTPLPSGYAGAPALVLDFEFGLYAADVDASLTKYTTASAPASLVLDFEEGQYATDVLASFDKYTVGGDEPSLVLDFNEAQYGRQS